VALVFGRSVSLGVGARVFEGFFVSYSEMICGLGKEIGCQEIWFPWETPWSFIFLPNSWIGVK
jgi:hypothetical protein